MTVEPPASTDAAEALRPGDSRLRAWRAFLRAHAGITRELERELGSSARMPLAWYDVLVQLVEAPDRKLRMADLADRVLLSRSGLTRLIDRLEAEGLVRREPSLDDARGTFTVLTREGYQRLGDASPAHLDGVRRHFVGRFTADELTQLEALLSRLP